MAEDWEVGTEVVVKIIEGSAFALRVDEEIFLVPENDAFRVEQLGDAIVTMEPADSAHIEGHVRDNIWHGIISASEGDALGVTLLSDNEATAADDVL